ncbi:uncharacterized protein BDZ99DRAFT_381066, partial [Mytilinidion resinicola]
LIVFNNINRDSKRCNTNPNAYNITRYLSGADHRLVLIISRLANLEQLGKSRKLGKLSNN